MPPSTTSSQTRSAELSPVCGRASREFSIFTASAGCGGTAPLSRPVSGHSTGGGGGGGGGGATEVLVTAGVSAAAGVVSSSLVQPTRLLSARPARSTAPRERRTGWAFMERLLRRCGRDNPMGSPRDRRSVIDRHRRAAPSVAPPPSAVAVGQAMGVGVVPRGVADAAAAAGAALLRCLLCDAGGTSRCPRSGPRSPVLL